MDKKTDATGTNDPGTTVPDIYYLESTEQLKVLSEPLRYQMTLLLDEPQTCAGLARALGLSRAKAHYHLKLLQSVGLIRPHSEAIKDGIVEKYYIVRGRMLNFRRLLPDTENDLPDNVNAETVSAVSGFLSTMLQVSGQKTANVLESADISKGHYFDFETTLTRAQFDDLKQEFEAIRDRVIAQSKTNQFAEDDAPIRFHLTNYLVPVSDEDVQ